MPGTISFETVALDATVARLGLLTGLLRKSTVEGRLEVDTSWFQNPLAEPDSTDPNRRSIRTISSDPEQRAELVALFEDLLGSVSAEALGVPGQAAGRKWHSVKNPLADAGAADADTGLYLVIEERTLDGDGGTESIVGLGMLHAFSFRGVAITPYAYVPFLRMPAPEDGSTFVLGNPAYSIELGIEITDPQGRFGAGDVSFAGVKVATTVEFTSTPLHLDLFLLDLKLPNQPAADRNINDLLHTSANDWVSAGVYLLLSQLVKVAPTSKTQVFQDFANALLAMLGLSGSTPAPDWNAIVHDPAHGDQQIVAWLRAIASDPATLSAWLNDWYCMLHGVALDPDKSYVTGSGSRLDPWSVELLQMDGNVIALTVATSLAKETNSILLYPGLVLSSKTAYPIAALAEVGVRIVAAAEMVELCLPPLGQPVPAPAVFPSFAAHAVLSQPTDAFKRASDADDPLISIGSIKAGLEYREVPAAAKAPSGSASSKGIYPSFQLTEINTPYGAWDTIDLLNYNELIKDAGEALATLIQVQLDKFFDVSEGSAAGKMARCCAAVLGVKVPLGYTSATWPVKDLLLAGPGGLEALIKDPLGALAGYYQRCLTTPDLDGKSAWELLLPSFAGIAGDVAGDLPRVSGNGSSTDPWALELFSLDPASPAAYLEAWRTDSLSSPGSPVLRLGMSFRVPLPVTVVAMTFALRFGLVDLLLPATAGGAYGANWLPDASADFTVTGPEKDGKATPLVTPALGGISLSSPAFVLAAAWTRNPASEAQAGQADSAFFGTAALKEVVLLNAGVTVESLGDIQFSFTPTVWTTPDLDKFTQLFFDAMGLWLLAYGGRLGVLAVSAFGLSPDLSRVFNERPEGGYPFALPELELPADWPRLDVKTGQSPSFFTDPWSAMRAQLLHLLSGEATAVPLMRLLGWAVSGELPALPSAGADGSRAKPWSVELSGFWSLRPLFWTTTADQSVKLGFGVMRCMLTEVSSTVSLAVAARVDLCEVQVTTVAVPLVEDATLPQLSTVAFLQAADVSKPLVDNPATGMQIGAARVGFTMDRAGVAPVAVLERARFDAESSLVTFDLATLLAQLADSFTQEQIFEALLYALMQTLTEAAQGEAGLTAMLQLLSDLQLLLPASGQQSAGLNMGAWKSMLANPADFIAAQMEQVLTSGTGMPAFDDSLSTLLGYPGFVLPESLRGLPAVLAALGLARDIPGGTAIALSAWVTLAKDPVGFLSAQGKRLLDPADDALRLALITALSHLPAPDLKQPLRDVPLSFSNGSLLTLRVPASKLIQVGGLLEVEAALVINLQNLSLRSEVSASSAFAGLRLLFTADLDVGSAALRAADFDTVNAVWGLALGGIVDQNGPAPFDPLVFYPLPDEAVRTAYLQRLGVQIPVLLVSSLATQLLNAFVVGDGEQPIYPVVHAVLEGFGLTIPNVLLDRPSQVQSLAGFLLHPLDWLLSPQALGDGTTFDLDKIGKLMHALPGENGISGPGDLKLVADGTQGMKVVGLPFGASTITFSSDTTDGIRIGASLSRAFGFISSEQLAAAGTGTPTLDISAAMSFGKGSGVNLSGRFQPSFVFDVTDPAKPTSLQVTAEYSVQGGFLLDLQGHLAGTSFPSEGGKIYLVPFKGLSQFQAGATALLEFAANQLMAEYAKYKADPQHNALVVTTVDNLLETASFFGITSVGTLLSTFSAVEHDPIAWLVSYFEEPKLTQTLAELVKLFGAGFLNVPGFSASGTLLTFQPPSLPAAIGQLQILVGQRDGAFGLWVEPAAARDWIFFAAQTGIALQTPLSAASQVVFTLDVKGGVPATALPAQMSGGPTVTAGVVVGTAADLRYFVRVYPAGTGEDAQTLLIELLPPVPHFAYGNAPETSVIATEWLPTFALNFLVPLIADLLLQTEKITGWLNQALVASAATSPTAGALLAEWGLLVQTEAGPPALYALHNLSTIFAGSDGKRMTPLAIIEQLFFVVLKGLDDLRIVPIGTEGGIFITSNPGTDEADSAGSTDYGLRLMLPDLTVWGGSANDAAANGSTRMQVQLGKWLTTPAACEKNWITASDKALDGLVREPGVLFYFLRKGDLTNDPHFHPKLELVTVGVDFTGTNGKPLVDVNGFQVGAMEPRLYFSLDFDRAADLQVGAAIGLHGMGIPLGPAQITGGSNTNPVAENLLASGTSVDGGGSEKDSVNPTFSINVAYVYDPKNSTDVYARFLSDDLDEATCSTFLWLAMQRAFGPIHCNQVGFGWENPYLQAGFDGSVNLAGLSMGLVNLEVGIPIKTPLDYGAYTLDLAGLSISYKGGPVSITGGFLKIEREIDGEQITEYTGLASLLAGQFGLTAIGSYALLGQNTPSLFIFAALSYPIGGPPYFFITGLAGGFGFNRSLMLPSQDTVYDFPFVAGALDPSYFGGNNPDAALTKLSEVSKPQRGQYWLAAGIKFTSFQMINAFALLTASFGTDFELALIGLATVDLPLSVKGGDSYTAIAHAGLQILVAFQPSIGQLAVTAALTLDSYVLDKSCHLTGGFAFYVWFPPNDHAGEFAVTLGGYHPRFDKPAYYPDEPRIGFSWLMPAYGITIRGGCYFALTPIAVMAGGSLELSFQKGNLRAWLNAEANFLIQWKPFHYDIDIGVTVGVSYRVDAWFVHTTFSIELSASLNLWGPPTGGKARISWYIISFTVYFGPDKEKKQPLLWPQFNESFLPAAPPSEKLQAAALERDARIDVQVSSGLIKSEIIEETGEVLRWVLNPQSVELLTSAVVPSTAIEVNASAVTQSLHPISASNRAGTRLVAVADASTDLGIVPMQVSGLQSRHVITLTKLHEETGLYRTADDLFDVVAVTRSVPRAMWSPQPPSEGQQLAKDQVIESVMIGARLTPKPIPYHSTLPVPLANLAYEAPGHGTFSWGGITPPNTPQYGQYPPHRTILQEMETLMDDAVAARRKYLLHALRAASVFLDPDVEVSLLASTADQVFLAQPILAPLGGVVNPVQAEG